MIVYVVDARGVVSAGGGGARGQPERDYDKVRSLCAATEYLAARLDGRA